MQSAAPTQPPELVQPNTSAPGDRPEKDISALAQQLAHCTIRRATFRIPARLKQFTRFFQGSYEYFEESTKAQVASSQTAEWLMDNLYVIEQAIRQVEHDLPADYYQRLPKTRDGWPRVYIVALANTQFIDTRLEIDQIKHFLHVFQ